MFGVLRKLFPNGMNAYMISEKYKQLSHELVAKKTLRLQNAIKRSAWLAIPLIGQYSSRSRLLHATAAA